MAYDMIRYHEEALATESPVTPEMTDRLLRAWEYPQEYLFEIQTCGQQMDRFKRHVYYGKIDGELVDELMPTYPTGEKAERIKQMTRVMHAVTGLITEVGEICEDILSFIENGGELNVKNLRVENGDLLWYINLFLACLKTTIVIVAEENVAKLKARYPQKFDALRAIERDLKNEVAAVEAVQIDPDLKEFLVMARRFRSTPVVDDDFPGMKHQFDSMMDNLLTKYNLSK